MVDGGPATIAAIVKFAKDDADEFGASWLDYRTFNPSGLDGKFAKAFSKTRADLMSEQKGFMAKLDKMQKLGEEAESLVKLIGKLSASALDSLEDAQDDAKKLATRVAQAMPSAEKNQGQVNTNATNLGKLATGPFDHQKDDPQKQLIYAQGVMKNMISLDKEVRNDLLSLAKVLETAQKSLKDYADDPQVKKSLGDALKSLAELKKVSDEIRKKIQAAAKDFQTVTARGK